MARPTPTRLEDLVVFARVVELGSFTRAAHALGSTRSAVSKSVARLERSFGNRLLNRTTRELSVTEAGRACYAHCARVEEEARLARLSADALHRGLRGTLRVDCSLALGLLLAPQWPRFLARHPTLRVDLSLSERVVDLVRQRIDVAVRLGRLMDSSLVAKKLAGYRRVLCASPGYLANAARLQTVEDLKRHACLMREGQGQWELGAGSRRVVAQVDGRFRADTPELLRQAAVSGLGVAMLPSFMIASDVATGRLVTVLDEVASEAAIYAVYPAGRYVSASVRALIEFLTEAVGALGP